MSKKFVSESLLIGEIECFKRCLTLFRMESLYAMYIQCKQSYLLGLNSLVALESLSLAYNLLKSEAVGSSVVLSLKKLKKLDLSRNMLNNIPESICNLTRQVGSIIMQACCGSELVI